MRRREIGGRGCDNITHGVHFCISWGIKATLSTRRAFLLISIDASHWGEEEEEEVFITSGNWRGKHNSLSLT